MILLTDPDNGANRQGTQKGWGRGHFFTTFRYNAFG